MLALSRHNSMEGRRDGETTSRQVDQSVSPSEGETANFLNVLNFRGIKNGRKFAPLPHHLSPITRPIADHPSPRSSPSSPLSRRRHPLRERSDRLPLRRSRHPLSEATPPSPLSTSPSAS